MANINLLPQEFEVGSATVKAIGLANKVAIGMGVLLVVIAIGGIIVNLLIQNQIKTIAANSENLKTNIQKLEGIEQKLFLIKDRAQKAAVIFNEKDISDNMNKLSSLTAAIPQDISLEAVNFNSGAANFSIISKSSNSMAQFINQIVGSKTFAKVTLKSFNYNPSQGYTLVLDVL
jgi:Tfp pilus assembly protein PilN